MKRSAPIRRTPLKAWRRKPEDKVTPDVAAFVFRRDGACVPSMLGAPGLCTDTFDNVLAATNVERMTLDHVRDHAMMGKRAPSDAAHLIVTCAGHGVQRWELANRDVIRTYLSKVDDLGALAAALYSRSLFGIANGWLG